MLSGRFRTCWLSRHWSGKSDGLCSLPNCQENPYKLHCTLHFAHYTIHIALCALHYAHCTMHIALWTLHHAHCTMHIAVWTLHYALYTMNIALCTLHYAQCTIHIVLCTLYSDAKMEMCCKLHSLRIGWLTSKQTEWHRHFLSCLSQL